MSEIYHSENIDKIASELISEYNINEGNYYLKINNNKPSIWDIGRVYQRLIIMIDNNPNTFVDNIIKLLSSWIVNKIDNYDSSLYYKNPNYIYNCYIEGIIRTS